MKRSIIVALCCVVFIVTGCNKEKTVTVSCAGWGYGQENGPSEWANMCSPTCAANLQSPIDIVTSAAVKQDLPPIGVDYTQTRLELFNNGHTIELADENPAKTNTITVNGSRYELLQIHFHSLSEHTVDGVHSPIEMHLVHSLSPTDLTVIGVMIQEGPSNVGLSTFWNQLPTEESSEHAEVTLDLGALLPANQEYFQYSGSLTTPNGANASASCAEIVNWVVMKEAITMSLAEIEAFKAIFSHNYRPVQPLNDRIVYSN